MDILENPLCKNEEKAQFKEPQHSTAHREEVDNLIMGVRERVTRSVLGQVSEQLDALENRAGNKGLNSETRPHKSEVQPTHYQRISEAEHQNKQLNSRYLLKEA